jgi:type IV pilus assembly protein PilX
MAPLTRPLPRGPRRQQGVVLFIALIVLVAMSLAGVAMIRSVDTSLGIAGNLSFKQATMQASDKGVQEAVAWINGASATTLQNSNAAVGYSSSIATEPDWYNAAVWAGAKAASGGATDAAGNRAWYFIHRLCTVADKPYNDPGPPANQCATYQPAAGVCTTCSMAVGGASAPEPPKLYYRITTRVEGPRNTVSIIQVSVLLQV